MESIFRDVSLFINIIGVGVCLLMSFVFLQMSLTRRRVGRRQLSLIFFIIGLIILNTVFNISGYTTVTAFFEPICNAFCFALAPLLYLYFRYKHIKPGRHWFFSIHFLPFYSILIYTLMVIIKPQWGFNPIAKQLLSGTALILVWNIHFFLYLLLAFKEWQKQTSAEPFRDLIIFWGVGSVWIINFTLHLYRFLFSSLPEVVYLNITLLFTSMMLWVAYLEVYGAANKLPARRRNTLKSQATANQHNHAIKQMVMSNEYHKDPSLDLRKLAELIEIPYHQLSRLINDQYQMNFNEFINSIRIEEVVESLRSGQDDAYTIMGLAERAGFNSSSAFYTAFRKIKGTTPKSFISSANSQTLS